MAVGDSGIVWGTGRFRYSELPAFSGDLSVSLRGGVPYFSESDFDDGGRWEIRALDRLGRARCAFMVIGARSVQEGARPARHLPDPCGWWSVAYPELSPSEVYDRSHLAAWVLTGAYGEPGNLFTATTTLNRSGMKPYENRVLRYIRQRAAAGEDSRVLYRVRPRFSGDDLLARGVLVEAASFADRGATLALCAWCYNVRPGVEIDYSTGECRLAAQGRASWGGDADGAGGGAGPFVVEPAAALFHRAECGVVAGGGRPGAYATGSSRESLVLAGYRACAVCRP